MSILKTVGMELIQANPYRMIEVYPWIEDKIEALMRSINDVGFWEGVIARPTPPSLRGKPGKGYQIAFGHHRVEAAKRVGLNRLDLIVRDLTDEQMIQFMGRENGEDYKADFIVMLNAWEGAKTFSPSGKNSDIGRLLGWTKQLESHGKEYAVLNKIGEACANAHKLIADGHMKMADFEGLSVSSVRDLVSSTKSHINTIEKRAEQFDIPEKEVKAAIKHVAKGASSTARAVREGKVAPRDITAKVVENSRKSAAYFAPPVPEFHKLAQAMSNQLCKVLVDDSLGMKLDEIEKNLEHITSENDKNGLRRLDFDLEQLAERATAWRKRLAATPKVVRDRFPMIEGGRS